MLNFFKHNYIYQQIVIVLLSVVLWLPAFITKSGYIQGDYTMPLYNIIVSLLDFSPFVLNLLSFLIFILCVFLFNSILSANRLVGKYSTTGAFSFIVLLCGFPELHSCYPFIFACPFLLMALHTLFLIYQTDAPENYMMNIGYFIAIASLLYYPSILLLGWVLISFIILKYDKLRYIMLPITGMIIINAIVLFISFMFGNIELMIAAYSNFFSNFSFSFEMSESNKILFYIFSALFLIALIRFFTSKNSDRAINVRKRIAIAVVLTIFATYIFFMYKPNINNGLLLMMYAFFFSVTLSDIKRSKIVNIMMFLVLIFVIANQYLPLLGITI